MENIATTTCVNQVTYTAMYSTTKNGGTPAYDADEGKSVLMQFDSIEPIFGTYNAAVIPSGMICKTEIDKNVTNLMIPDFFIVFLLTIMVILKVFEFRNPWKQ